MSNKVHCALSLRCIPSCIQMGFRSKAEKGRKGVGKDHSQTWASGPKLGGDKGTGRIGQGTEIQSAETRKSG